MIQAAGVAIDKNKQKITKSLFLYIISRLVRKTVFGPLTIHEKKLSINIANKLLTNAYKLKKNNLKITYLVRIDNKI